ncbi:MAG: hypothetical protein D3916_15965 [Candidatus Electrothrix sp. MAN1_4]|nr:hypothetical protein [Candidatus Electrothrix sp. MAN1_4]
MDMTLRCSAQPLPTPVPKLSFCGKSVRKHYSRHTGGCSREGSWLPLPPQKTTPARAPSFYPLK